MLKLTVLVIVQTYLTIVSCNIRYLNGTDDSPFQCPEYDNVDFGVIHYKSEGDVQIATIICEEGYDLDGNSQIECIDGAWGDSNRPTCVKRCPPPPFLKNGGVEIEGEKDGNGYYRKGTLATYSCSKGSVLFPSQSRYRVCENGTWSGPAAKCMSKYFNCPPPRELHNGYYKEISDDWPTSYYLFGQRIKYMCNQGYTLHGESESECLADGTWSTKETPRCQWQTTENADEDPCRAFPLMDHTSVSIIRGFQTVNSALPGTILEISCMGKYRNAISPCQPSRMTCLRGKWIGNPPNCILAKNCYAPPIVPYASVVNVNFEETEIPPTRYSLESRIMYKCLSGYVLDRPDIFTCSIGGCWFPNTPPQCVENTKGYYLEINGYDALMVSAATGFGVLALLILVCLGVLCKRRKPLSRGVPITAPVLRSEMRDHASLLHNPDRLALIAFADGVQNSNEDSLPTYDEAVRRAPGSLNSNRLARPQWPNLVARRSRNSPNPDLVSVTRHGSFASHSPSTRSGVDSMGSTDTMAISEGSTIVTLDTASSHSGSQPASCRAHCGSLASFDACSVVNTEDVPLIEENEIEETNVGIVGVESISTSDTSSFKSADIP